MTGAGWMRLAVAVMWSCTIWAAAVLIGRFG